LQLKFPHVEPVAQNKTWWHKLPIAPCKGASPRSESSQVPSAARMQREKIMTYQAGDFVRAAVVREAGKPLQIEQVRLGEIRRDEVLVRIVACGVCHTDMVVRDQEMPSPLPAILGHEGAGIVEAVGEGVTNVAPGDHVVLSFMKCGECYLCEAGHPAHCQHVGPINFGGGRLDGTSSATDAHGECVHDHFFGQSSFAEYSIASVHNVVKVPKDLPLEILAPLVAVCRPDRAPCSTR
jgi:aryl-alcohol dehydrogenase